MDLCNKKKIQLITIFEDEWINNRELIERRLSHRLGVFNSTSTINARDCKVKVIEPHQKNNFLNKHHLQGADISKIHLGLFNKEDNLVSVMTFSRPSRCRNSQTNVNNKGLWELNRFASHGDYQVRGGAGKLLKHFQRNYNWSEIYSYADRRWSEGKLYSSLGFKLQDISKPNYWYIKPPCPKRIYRYTFTKSKLIEEGFNPKLSEREIMKNRGYARIWDCGMLKYHVINTSA